MTWLLAFLVKHAVEISAIGVAAGAVANVQQVAVNTVAIVREASKDEDKKD